MKTRIFFHFSTNWQIWRRLRLFSKFQKICQNFGIIYSEPGFFAFLPESEDFAKSKTILQIFMNLQKFRYSLLQIWILSYFSTNRHVRRRLRRFCRFSNVCKNFGINCCKFGFIYIFPWIGTFDGVWEHFQKLQKFWYKLIQTRFFCFSLSIGTFINARDYIIHKFSIICKKNFL